MKIEFPPGKAVKLLFHETLLFRYAATADFIIALKNFPKHKVVNFTFHDFFPAIEIDKFLQLFTAPIGPLTRQNAKECLNMKLCNLAVYP